MSNTKHATGQVMRKKNKQVVDSFPEMEKFRAKIEEVCHMDHGHQAEAKVQTI